MLDDLNKTLDNIIYNNKYIHYKNGEEYQIIDRTIKIQENSNWIQAVLYQDKDGNKFVRSEKEFNKKFTLKN